MAETEIDLLIELARSSLEVKHQDRIKQFCEDGVDWPLFFELVEYHRVFPLVYKHLAEHFPHVVPAPVFEQCKQKARQSGMKNLMFFKILLELTDLFKKHSLSVLPFKGPLLSEYLYGDVTLRTYGDLDILIDRKDVVRVHELLVTNGFQSLTDINPDCLAIYTRVEDNLCFYKEGSPVIEVHWELSGCLLPVPYDYNFFASRNGIVTVMGREFECMADEDLVIYLCLHGTRHNWQYYELLVCLGSLLESRKIDWHLVLKIAKELHCHRVVLNSLSLAGSLYGVRLNQIILQEINNDKKIGEMTSVIKHRLLQNSINAESEDSRFSFYRFKVQDNAIEKIRLAFKLFFIPSKREWQLFKVPDKKFVFLYWVVRPFRIVRDVLLQKVWFGGRA